MYIKKIKKLTWYILFQNWEDFLGNIFYENKEIGFKIWETASFNKMQSNYRKTEMSMPVCKVSIECYILLIK